MTMPLKKKFVWHILHKGEVVGITKTKKSAKKICKSWFPRNCSFKLVKVM